MVIPAAAQGGMSLGEELVYDVGEGPVLLEGVGESLRGGILSLTLSRPLASANPLIL